jgi:hypothetical protein
MMRFFIFSPFRWHFRCHFLSLGSSNLYRQMAISLLFIFQCFTSYYIFTRFKNTALLATYNTFKYKAEIRELGKVFGLP